MSSKPVLKLKGEKGDVAVVEDEKGECGAEEEDVCETQESLGLESFTEPASPDVPAVASTSSHVCALRSCRRSLEDKSRVRIKAHPSPPAPDPKALVVWEPSGYAEFHRECWEVFDFNSFNGIRPRLRLKCSRKELAVLKVSAKTAEHFDAPCVFSTKARKAAELIRTAKHCVVFTGAGISTCKKKKKRKMV